MNDDKMSLEVNNGKHKIKMSFTRTQIEDYVEAELTRILNREMRINFNDYVDKKERKQIFSELDPYGEEDWDG